MANQTADKTARTALPAAAAAENAGLGGGSTRSTVDATARNFAFGDAKLRAVMLVAADEMQDKDIAAEVGIGTKTLYTWKSSPEFAARVQDARAEIAAGALRFAIAKKHNRIAWLDDLASRMRRTISDRAAAAAADDAAPIEAHSGLYTARTVMASSGRSRTDWSFDGQLVREYRSTLEQAARELGQISDRVEVTGETIVRRYVGIDVDAV